jgi:hypothetical protein
MSEYGDEVEFEGGFFDEAGITAEQVPDDPFGFGKDFWALRVMEVGKAMVTKKADKVGFMVKFGVDDPQFQGTPFADSIGNGSWFQLPVPLHLRDRISWEPSSAEAKDAMFKLAELYQALGFKRDEFGSINGPKLLGRGMLAKISPKRNDQGFWNFNLFQMKPLDENAARGGISTAKPASGNGKTDAELLEEELKNA